MWTIAMPMKLNSRFPVSEQIFLDLQSASTTTAQTTANLRTLLCGEAETRAAKTLSRTPQSNETPSITSEKSRGRTGRETKNPRSEKPTSHKPSKDADLGPVRLTTNEQRTLATEVFNHSLKCLSAAVRTKQNAGRELPPNNKKSSKTQVVPLQECSPNKQTKSIGRLDVKKKHIDENVDTVADCAVIALDCLRQLQPQAEKDVPSSECRVEKGATVLIERLISLGLSQIALSETSKIHEQYWKRRKDSKPINIGSNIQLRPIPQALPCILGPNQCCSQSDFDFICSYQSQVLRLAILLRSAIVTDEFLTDIGLAHDGSPAKVILSGLETGYIDREKAGEQLRTIGQALLKLYANSVSDGSRRIENCNTHWKLLNTALIIRIRSWEVLRHKADPDSELWTHFWKGLKRFEADMPSSKSTMVDPILLAIHQIASSLNKNGFRSVVPFNVISAGLDIVEKCCNHEAGLALITKCLETSNNWPSEEQILLRWRVPVILYKSSNKISPQLIEELKRCLESFSGIQTSKVHNISSLLLYGARLRKTIALIIGDLDQSPSKQTYTEHEIKTIDLGSQTLKYLLDLCFDLTVLPNDENSTEDRKLVLTTFARTFESILDVTKQSAKSTASLKTICDTRFKQCIAQAHQALKQSHFIRPDSEIVIYMQNLLVRSSNMYWTQYVSYGASTDASEHDSKLLELSCFALAGLPLRLQQLAKYGMKLEKLAVAWLAKKDVKAACQSFEAAIKHYSAAGGLEEATQRASSMSSQSVWSQKGSCSYSMGKALQSLTKLRLTYEENDSTGTWIYDDSNCSPVQRSLIFEAQMSALATQAYTVEQAEAIRKHVSDLLTLYYEPDLYVFRIRFLSTLLYTTSKNVSLSTVIDPRSQAIRQIVDIPSRVDRAIPLSNFEGSLRPLLQIQWLLHSEKVEVELFHTHVKSLSSFIQLLKDKDALLSSVDDLNILLNEMQAVIDLGRALDDIELMMPCLTSINHILTLTPLTSSSRSIENLTQLATLYHRLGKVAEAEKAFKAAERLFAPEPDCSSFLMKWTSCYSEFLLDTFSTEKAFMICQGLIAHNKSSTLHDDCPRSEQIGRELELSRFMQVASRIASEVGNIDMAFQFARQAVRLSAQIWQRIERSQSKDQTTSLCGNDSLQTIITDLSSLSLTYEHSPLPRKLRGNAYWNCIDVYVGSLRRMASLSIMAGTYQDARYYTEQLKRVADAVEPGRYAARASAQLALLYAKAGNTTESLAYLKPCSQRTASARLSEDYIYLLDWAEALISTGDSSHAMAILDDLLTEPKIVDTNSGASEEVKTGIHKQAMRGKKRAVRPTKLPPKRPGKPNTLSVGKSVVVLPQQYPTRSQQIVVERRQALLNRIKLLDPQEASVCPTQFDNLDVPNIADDVTVTSAILMLRQAFIELSSDAVKCVLGETAVALPVRYRSSRKSGRASFLPTADFEQGVKSAGAGRSKAASSKQATWVRRLSSGEKLIIEAQKLLSGHSEQRYLCPSELLHTINKVESKLMLLSTTIGVSTPLTSFELLVKSLASKDIVLNRERYASRAEHATQERAHMLQWPDGRDLQKAESVPTILNYTVDDLSEIPETWSVVTISLADDKQELLMSKIVRRQSPFLLRIPLSRSDVEINDSIDFSFDEAKAEFLDIVTEANVSTHDPRGQGGRELRKEWYSERESLDQRLQTWLCNVENIWLGGFRGLMSASAFSGDLLEKLGHKFNVILNKHLPSRQKSANSLKNKVTLHAHVLGLFLGLGNPSEQDLDDALTDLLYFVVDILQFGGEHNAYDEIDFDAMLVDVLEIIQYYHDLAESESSDTRHTILVVDKELAAFPWESLPCLRAQSVSRMPSLGAILERLKKIREISSEKQGYYVAASKGAYVLNPSSDLASTQATFEPILRDQLVGYTSVINKKPTESEFTSLLTENQLLLYFGHGSGAQYIRGRTIRSLDSCAVTLLLGCSSAKMTECGQYESYGMPGYYIGGDSGCMAVMGTLWDVTDRDIDRFALKTMVEWGLLDEDESVSKALERSNKKTGGRKQKASTKGVRIEDRRGLVSLDEAVNRGRDACLLRYLNGAAPVVYGIPVFLE